MTRQMIFAGLLVRVRAGAEVIIESGNRPTAIVHPAEPVRRTISDSLLSSNAQLRDFQKIPELTVRQL
jgi:antitoxin (DNA-binding transcriptional repressor) of toxin-antitoxin stability system